MRKNTETLVAQGAAYAETLSYSDRLKCITNLAQVAAGSMEDEQIDALASRNEGYAPYLREAGTRDNDAIQLREQMFQNYGEFEADVNALLERWGQNGFKAFDMPEFLGGGDTADVFTLEKGDEQYAVRVISPIRYDGMGFAGSQMVAPMIADDRIAASIAAKGAPEFETIVAASLAPRNSITIAKRMPGENLYELPGDDFEKIQTSDLERLVELAAIATEKDLVLTATSDNIMFDEKAGFGLIDFFTRNAFVKKHDEPQFSNLDAIIRALGKADQRPTYDSSPATYQKIVDTLRGTTLMHERLLSVLERYPEDSEERSYVYQVARRIREKKANIDFFEHYIK